MNILSAYSTKETVEGAVSDIREQLAGPDVKTVLFFASSSYDADSLAGKMQAAFGNTPVFGCSTSGEIVSGKMLKNSVVAMSFNSKVVGDIRVEVVENIRTENRIDDTMASFGKYYKTPMSALDHNKYVGIILVDGLSGAEERLMDRIGDLTNVTFIGGSAGDDLKFAGTCVFANGKAYSNAAVLALMKPETAFDIIKTQSFCSLPKKLVATKVNEAAREVLEFNNMAASKAYAEALGKPVGDASNSFMRNPVGLMAGDEPYVRSPQQMRGDSMVFYCNILQGMELSLLESTDIVSDTRLAVEKKKKEMGGISGIINFHCILRTLELESEGRTGEYGKIFADMPTIGFSTYGEQYIGHINQTSTMLAFR